jgi:hypothetical protein
VESILNELLTRHRSEGRVDLNDIAEVIDARSVTYEEVELIITRLEAEGSASANRSAAKTSASCAA